MRYLPGLLTCTVLAIAHATAASLGHVYTFDHKSPQSDRHPQTTSPEAARLIFAQRLGLSRYYSLNIADNLTLQQLNDFGAQRARLFGSDEEALKPAKLLVLVDGVLEPEGVLIDIRSI